MGKIKYCLISERSNKFYIDWANDSLMSGLGIFGKPRSLCFVVDSEGSLARLVDDGSRFVSITGGNVAVESGDARAFVMRQLAAYGGIYSRQPVAIVNGNHEDRFRELARAVGYSTERFC